MKPRHLLLALPLLALVGCSGNDSSNSAPGIPANRPAGSAAPSTDAAAGSSESTEIPAWETDGPVDEAAATARDVLLKDLDSLRKAGEDMVLTNPDMTDEAVRDAVIAAANVGSDVVADGATGIRVTATEGEISCFGVLAFKSGIGTWNSVECS